MGPQLSRRAFLSLCGAGSLGSVAKAQTKVTEQQLRSLLSDPATAEEALTTYFEIDNSVPFAPKFELRPDVTITSEGGHKFAGQKQLIGVANEVTRILRQRRYRERILQYPERIRVVAKGDSWFQYPDPRVSDIVDQLFNYFNIYSIASAGDKVSNMFIENEYIPALQEQKAKILLLSGGGNDVLGQLDELLTPAGEGRPAEEYISKELRARVEDVGNIYHGVFSVMSREWPNVPVVTHGYDYVIPRPGGPWLGPALARKGATTPTVQSDVIRLIVDRMNDTLAREAKKFPHAHVVDLRGVVRATGWYDEIHPNNRSFQQVALRLQSAIFNAVDSHASRGGRWHSLEFGHVAFPNTTHDHALNGAP